jgi:hypothetical protein
MSYWLTILSMASSNGLLGCSPGLSLRAIGWRRQALDQSMRAKYLPETNPAAACVQASGLFAKPLARQHNFGIQNIP